MLALALTAELQGVTDLKPTDTADSPFYYTFRVQCTSCRETHANWVSFNRHEMNEQSGSRGEANFVWKCKNCKVCPDPKTSTKSWFTLLTKQKRESTATIKAAPATYEASEPAKKRNIIEIDCRGLEFTEFKSEGEWEAKGTESGSKFADIDLSEGEWFDYDEKAGEEVSIKDIKWEIRRA